MVILDRLKGRRMSCKRSMDTDYAVMERVLKDESYHSEETNKEGDGVGVLEEFIQ